MLNRKPEISYPAAWGYSVIGDSEADIRLAIHQVVGERDYQTRLANSSSGGRYHSVHLELVVGSEDERVSIYECLKRHPDVRLVL